MNPFTTQTSQDGTIKITFKEGYHSVIIPTKDEKNALCVSCQIGCPVGCKFCFSGNKGFKRNLTSEEIINQFEIAKNIIKKTPQTIVFMGMGEPSLNLEEVKKAAEYFHKFLPFNHITISTSCISKKLSLLEDIPYGIAISLHSPFDKIRKKIMGSTVKVKDIVKFTQNCREKRNKRTILIEYCLIKNINDSKKDLKKLISFKWPEKTMFNLIEFNDFGNFKKSNEENYQMFQKEIIKSGFKCFTRRARGKDIDAACGMLN